MTKKRITGALAVLACALYFGAIGAGSASASWTETCTAAQRTELTFTWYTEAKCKTLFFNGPYHRVLDKPLNSIWTHIFLPASADSQVSATITGTKLTVTCEGLSNSSGVAENVEELGVKKVKGREMTIVYSKCKVTAPVEKGCKVAETVTSAKLQSTAAEPEKTQKVWLEPEVGTRIATFPISGCSISTLNGEKELTGSIVGVVPSVETEESLIDFTTSSGSSLKLGGSAATYTGETEAEGEEEVEGKKEKTGLLFIGE